MTVFWLIVWAIDGAPALHQWNAWLIALLVCIVADALGSRSKA